MDYKEINEKIESEDFKNYCKENIIPKVKKFNGDWIKSIITIIILSILYFFIFKFALEKMINNILYKYIIIFFGLYIVYVMMPFIIKNYKTKVKKIILPLLLSYFGNFETEPSPDFMKLISNGLFKHCNRIELDDAIIGEYKSVPVEIFEFVADNSNGIFNGFKGIVVTLPYQTKIDAPFIICPFGKNTENEKYKVVPVNNEEFSKYFVVYAEDVEKAAENIDDELLNKLIDAAHSGYDKKMSISAEQGKLKIALSLVKDYFEISFFKSPSDINNCISIMKDLSEILKAADLFI